MSARQGGKDRSPKCHVRLFHDGRDARRVDVGAGHEVIDEVRKPLRDEFLAGPKARFFDSRRPFGVKLAWLAFMIASNSAGISCARSRCDGRAQQGRASIAEGLAWQPLGCVQRA
jgi:hypothetical protein